MVRILMGSAGNHFKALMVKKKRGKRALTFYRIAFGLEPTYKVLVHPELVRVAITRNVAFMDGLEKTIPGQS